MLFLHICLRQSVRVTPERPTQMYIYLSTLQPVTTLNRLYKLPAFKQQSMATLRFLLRFETLLNTQNHCDLGSIFLRLRIMQMLVLYIC